MKFYKLKRASVKDALFSGYFTIQVIPSMKFRPACGK